jgi:RimJ/RimL family protein N-acetyltransferase
MSGTWRVETERLLLQPIAVADAEEMASVLGDPRLYAFTGGAPETAAELAVRYARWARGSPEPGQRWVNLIARERAGSAAVGWVQATVESPDADLAWVIGLPWQGRGYATEAMRGLLQLLRAELGVRNIRALIHPAHRASQRVAERLGLVVTAGDVRGEQVWLGTIG